jgi:Major Facilitator Superfamily
MTAKPAVNEIQLSRVLFLLTPSVFINYSDRGNLSIAAPLLKNEFHLSATQLGILLSSFFWTYSCFLPASGWLVDRLDVKWVIAGGFFLWSAATAATGAVHAFGTLLLVHHKVRDILKRHEREHDYVEVNLNAEHRYNPLYNDLDAYALAYNIASLLNNLFGKGKEPFWQQAYTNLVKFIVQLHKVAYDYVTLFDLYECAINPELIEKRIHEAERMLQSRSYYIITAQVFLDHQDLERFGFDFDEPSGSYKAPQSLALAEALRAANINFHCETENPADAVDLSLLVRRQPDGQANLLSAEGVLRPQAER